MNPKRAQNRRGLLVFAAIGAGMLALPRWLADRDADIVPHGSAHGFRLLRTEALSLRMDPLIGLGAGHADRPPAVPPANLCTALFGDGNSPDPDEPAPSRVAYFTDANCPQCRLMERWLKDVPAERARITVLDLPLLGPSSVAAARAIGAAGMMGAEARMRSRLHRIRVRPDPAYLARIADGMGLDRGRLLANLSQPEIDRRISENLGAAAALAIPGTPALVVGDVVVIGRIERAQFDRLIGRYRPAPCDDGG